MPSRPEGTEPAYGRISQVTAILPSAPSLSSLPEWRENTVSQEGRRSMEREAALLGLVEPLEKN